MFSVDLKDLTVLLVEDDVHFRELLKTILTTLDIENIVEAENGYEAIEMLDKHQIDIAFMDWKMSGLNGIECVQKIRSEPSLSDKFIPIIMITGHQSDELIAEARDVGVNEVLIKPISARSLLSCFVRVMERQNVFVDTDNYFGPDRRRINLPLLEDDRRTAQLHLLFPPVMKRKRISL
ncbi:MAG: response regulator [Alphaproteobacteria bacterium]|nr:response regulator [Rhodospirillales bacterium]MCW9045955.1 response regulator [Alphaproteobacteria bacterium]